MKDAASCCLKISARGNRSDFTRPETCEVNRDGEQQADDHENGHGRIRHDVNYGGAHVVVATGRSVRMLVLFKDDGISLLADPHLHRKGVRLRNLG